MDEKELDEEEKKNGVAELKERGATSLYWVFGLSPIVLMLAYGSSGTLEKGDRYCLSLLLFFAFHLGRLVTYWSVWKAGYTKQLNIPNGANGLARPSE